MDSVTIATLALSVVTLALVGVTYRQVLVNRRALELSIRPLLGDPPPPDAAIEEVIQFGAPGRQSLRVTAGHLYVSVGGEGGIFQVSVALRNIGAGVAAIQGASTDPEVPGSVEVSRKFVPVGEHVRVNISVLTTLEHGRRFAEPMWAVDPFTIAVEYSDLEGRQALTSKAVIKQFATQGPWVAEIAVYKTGESEPLVVGRSSVV